MTFGAAAAGRPFPRPDDMKLPDRVRRAIRRQEEQSEILIGWAQLTLVLILGTLYLLAPRAAGSAGGGIQPAPVALLAYLGFTLARLFLAHRRLLPGWLVGLSIGLDMALLMGLIWSFHVQYAQPASFYLKAPTLLYVFIFIALRALRFNPRFVLTAGLVGALGWLLLVAYAVARDPSMDMITRNYVEYLTGNKILVGAEFDKVISILLVTAILTFALTRARRLLVLAVSEGEAVRDLERFFAPDVARAITRAEQRVAAGQGMARDAAILMIDIRGFSRLAAAASPETVVGMLGDYQRRMLPAIAAGGGTVDKFLGDGIMATFGAVRPSATAAADALRTLDAVLAAAERWNAERAARGESPVTVNAAAADGPVVVGAVGDGERLEFTVIGDAVNRAAKLEKHCKVEEARAVAPHDMMARAVDQGYRPAAAWQRRDGRRCTGLDRPVDLAVRP